MEAVQLLKHQVEVETFHSSIWVQQQIMSK